MSPFVSCVSTRVVAMLLACCLVSLNAWVMSIPSGSQLVSTDKEVVLVDVNRFSFGTLKLLHDLKSQPNQFS